MASTEKTDAPKKTTSADFPPMSNKAPTPFGSAAKAADEPSSASAGFPPMSNKAPTPFGVSKSAQEEKSGMYLTLYNFYAAYSTKL